MPDQEAENESMSPTWRDSAGVGSLAGALNGLIALGGGIIMTPYLLTRRAAAPQAAVGTSLAVVVVLSSIGFLMHFALGGLILGAAEIGLSVLAGVIGAFLGARLLAHLTPRWMLMLFGVFVLLVAARLIAHGLGFDLGSGTPDAGDAVPASAFLALGAVSGVLSGVFGVGGGALVLLGLATFYGVPVQEGLPVALALNVSNALFGLVHHSRAGHVLWHEVKVLMPTAVVGIALGAWLALSLPADFLRVGFGAFFVYTGTRMIRQGLRRTSAS